MTNKKIAYKIMNGDLTSTNGYQFEVGKTYQLEKYSRLNLHCKGFHFCFNPIDCLWYYNNCEGDKRFFMVEYDKVIKDDVQGCTNKITILKEINIIDYIRENKDIVDWELISSYQKFTPKFMLEFKDRIDWKVASVKQTLIEDLIRELKKYVVWKSICQHQKLSESFIKEFKNKVNWCVISRYQNLSESFIREFQECLNWGWLELMQDLSDEFKDEFKHKLKGY